MSPAAPIDRRALVQRHAVRLQGLQRGTALSVGNGSLAFSADATGLQTFPQHWQVPLAMLAEWAWHEEPNPQGHTLADALQPHECAGRTLWLPSAGWPHDKDHAAAAWLERNPHKMAPARVALWLRHANGRAAEPQDLHEAEQTLQLWDGSLHSRFTFAGHTVQLATRVHPRRDLLNLRLHAPAALHGRLGVVLHLGEFLGPAAAAPGQYQCGHHQVLREPAPHGQARWLRVADDTRIGVHASASGLLDVRLLEVAGQAWLLAPCGQAPGPWDLQIEFHDGPVPIDAALPTAGATRAAVSRAWQRFWRHGAALDLSGSSDPRAHELERRAVLSQYRMAVHASGSLPAAETGLSSLSWHGKFHLEMHAWHSAHHALWGRPQRLARSMDWYLQQLPQAQARAREQGFAGARWPKMVGPAGRESPGAINPLILWQQPQPIHLAELLWRATPASRQGRVLKRHAELVEQTADFLASVLQAGTDGHLHIGPPVAPAQETHQPASTRDPTFELAYFRWALQLAQQWQERRGLPPRAGWQAAIDRLAPLPQHDGLYIACASQPDLWARAANPDCRDNGEPLTLDDLMSQRCVNVDHPSFLGACGWLPGHGVDQAAMRGTLRQVLQHWNLSKVWGWDFGLLAMSAARLGEPEMAVDLLLRPSVANQWGPGGDVRWKFLHSYQPANGALLTALACMAAGWDGAKRAFPGFPDDNRWQVRAEGLLPLP